MGGVKGLVGLGMLDGRVVGLSRLAGLAVPCPGGESGMVGEWGVEGWRGGVSGASARGTVG